MSTQKKEYGFSNKWSHDTEANGFTQIPNVLLTCQGGLGISHSELVTLIQLISYWYKPDGDVNPSIATIARRANNGYSTTHRHLKSLEDKGFIKRIHRYGTSNRYDLKPCAIMLHRHQRSCELCIKISHKRGVKISKVSKVPSSKPIKKEYQQRRLNKNTPVLFSRPMRASDLLTDYIIGKTQ